MGKAYMGVSNIARTGEKGYVGVNDIARTLQKAYIGDANGKARLVYTAFDPTFPSVTVVPYRSDSYDYDARSVIFNKDKWLEAKANGYTKLCFDYSIRWTSYGNNLLRVLIGTPEWNSDLVLSTWEATSDKTYSGSMTIAGTRIDAFLSNGNYNNVVFDVNVWATDAPNFPWVIQNAYFSNIRFEK